MSTKLYFLPILLALIGFSALRFSGSNVDPGCVVCIVLIHLILQLLYIFLAYLLFSDEQVDDLSKRIGMRNRIDSIIVFFGLSILLFSYKYTIDLGITFGLVYLPVVGLAAMKLIRRSE